jgi:putative tricarboxylic transport membrane protein
VCARTEQIDKVYSIFGAMLVANVMFFALGLFAAKLFARVTLVPRGILWPIVFAFSVLGAYSLAQSMLDVYIALIFGVVGYLFRRFGFAVAPVAIGLILGEMVETNLQNSLKIFEGDWTQILMQPLAAFFLILAVLGISQPYIVGYFRKRKARRAQS